MVPQAMFSPSLSSLFSLCECGVCLLRAEKWIDQQTRESRRKREQAARKTKKLIISLSRVREREDGVSGRWVVGGQVAKERRVDLAALTHPLLASAST